MRTTPGFLGANGNLLVDLTLIIQILFFITLCAGVAVQLMANRGKPHLYKWHDRLQAPVVVLNLLFIIIVMIPTFFAVAGGASGNFGASTTWVPIVHGTLGLMAQGVAIYCFLAGFKILPRKIGTLRYFMWAAFALWTITLLFGIGVYLAFYTGGADASGSIAEHDADLISEHDQTVAEAPVEAPPELVEEHAEEPVQLIDAPTASSEPVEEHAEEPVDVAPTATGPTPTQSPASAAELERLGFLRISDGSIHGDKVTVQMSGFVQPEAGFVYEGWLQSNGAAPVSIGVLALSGDSIDHEFIDPAGRNLLNSYNGMFITLEPASDSDPNPSGVVVYSSEVPPAVMAHVRHVVTAFPGTPDGDGFALNALAEMAVLLQQVEVLQESALNNNLTDLLIHSETMLNIIEGSDSPDYGDRDGDGATYNPGDGYGLLTFGDQPGYLEGAAEHATLAQNTAGASAEVALHAGHVVIAAANATERAEQLSQLGRQILQITNAADAANLVAEVASLAEAMSEGVDVNGDGQIAPIPGEGGIRTMYEHGQLMGGIEIFATDTSTPVLIDEHAEETVDQPTPAQPTATPAPAATATPVPQPTPTIELISEHDEG